MLCPWSMRPIQFCIGRLQAKNCASSLEGLDLSSAHCSLQFGKESQTGVSLANLRLSMQQQDSGRERWGSREVAGGLRGLLAICGG